MKSQQRKNTTCSLTGNAFTINGVGFARHSIEKIFTIQQGGSVYNCNSEIGEVYGYNVHEADYISFEQEVYLSFTDSLILNTSGIIANILKFNTD